MVFISTVLTILGPFLVGKGIDIYIVEKSGNHFFFFFRRSCFDLCIAFPFHLAAKHMDDQSGAKYCV